MISRVRVLVDLYAVLARKSEGEPLDRLSLFHSQHRPLALGAGRTESEVQGPPGVEGTRELSLSFADFPAVFHSTSVLLELEGGAGSEEFELARGGHGGGLLKMVKRCKK